MNTTITKTIKLSVERNIDEIICNDLTTLSLVVGAKSVSGNLSYYKVKKVNNKYVVPVSVVVQRIGILEKRRNDLNESLDIMRLIVK
jgi:hypothetical protein